MKQNTDFFAEVIVGLFMTAVLGLLIYFTLIISGTDLFNGKHKVPVEVAFDDVGGLKVRDSVMMRGMTVGSVSEMQLANHGVQVTLLIDEGLTFKEGYRISVNTGSLLGGCYLLIEEGQGPVVAQGHQLQGESPNNWMRDLGKIVANLRDATEGDHLRNIITNLDASVQSVRLAIERVEKGQGMLGKLFSDDMSLYNDLSNAVSSLRSVAVKIDSGDNSLGRLINDDGSVYTNLSASIVNLKTISDRLEKGEGTLGKLLSSDSKVYDDLQATVENLKTVSARLEAGTAHWVNC